MRRILTFLICILVIAGACTLTAADNFSSTDQKISNEEPVKVTLLSQDETVQPGHPFWVAIQMNIAKDWHSYWKNPGDAGMATDVKWHLPKGYLTAPIEWPTPKRFSHDSLVGFGYEGSVIFLAKIVPPNSASLPSSVEISAEVSWVVCSDSTCLPGSEEIKIQIPISASTPQPNQELIALFDKAHALMPKQAETVTATRKEDLVKVTLSDPKAKQEYTHAYFCPDETSTIDYKIEAVVNRTPGDSENVNILLKETESADKSVPLKGVVVLHGDNPNQSSAYEIALPIKDSPSNNEISMADKPLVSKEENAMEDTSAGIPLEFEGGLGLALVLAFAGGMTLNLMPCVLPVISFKVLSFVKLAGQSRKLVLTHGLMFTLGVLVSFWVLTAALLVLQAYGHSVGWGFQLQEPLFVAILAAILLVFGLSLFGVFEIGTSLISIAGQAQQNAVGKGSGLLGSFLSGVLATAVATPCTGPFLGSAVGFAMTLPPILTLLVFTSLGLGMSLPYLVFATFPSTLRFLPRPGNWMVIFKELMGFLMLATVLWLVWVFGAQTSTFALFLLLAGFFFLALGSWIYGKWNTSVKQRVMRMIGYTLALACFALGAYAIANSASPWAAALGTSQHAAVEDGAWEKFSPERVAELQKQGIPVFIDFTAKWCLICQANHLVLSTNEVSEEFAKRGVVRMKADWTKNDPVITAELRKHGRSGVPLYLLYGVTDGEQPKILSQVLTPETVMTELKNIPEKK